ncbi:MAG: phosphate acyltransferase PlsX [Oscillospiraceae bacterium]|nr:phosphate acyltransferase PlsX [Oscillospiraceae bacterium]
MKIVIDAFGGDNAPLEILRGAVAAKCFGEQLALCGNVAEIEKCAKDNGLDIGDIELLPANSVMDMHDDAKLVLKGTADSSLAVGLKAVADGEADAFVSAGPTGALIMGATLIVKRIKGVKRPAFGAVIPSVSGYYILMDCGANVECRPEMLDQFGTLGSIYMQRVLGIERPRVGLANNGAEDSKGTELQIEAYKLLAKNPSINFVGNIEGRDIPLGAADVVVADGFTGNMILKTIEGMGSAMMKKLKGVFYKNLTTKLAAAVLKPALREFKDSMDYEKLGGAPIIGLTKPVVKSHGSSSAEATKNAVKQAIDWSRSGVTQAIEKAVAAE